MKHEHIIFIERFHRPSAFDKSAYLTICTIKNEHEVWVQVSKDEDNPEWIEFLSLTKAQEFINNKLQSI